jgi:UDP-N-acetyl-D-galactosamine dehydrogenase
MIADPEADAEEAKQEYGIVFDSVDDIKEMDAIIIAVGHDRFLEFTQENFTKMFKDGPNESKVLLDIKGILDRKEYELEGYKYWRL